LTPQRVVEEGGEDRSVPLAFERRCVWRVEKLARLVIAERRRLPLVALYLGTLHALYWIVLHSVLLAQILEQRREGREPAPNRRTRKAAEVQVVAPGDHVRAIDFAHLGGRPDASEVHERLQVGLIRAARPLVVDVGEPFELWRNRRELLKLRTGEKPFR
jgi:hypothetical protein